MKKKSLHFLILCRLALFKICLKPVAMGILSLKKNFSTDLMTFDLIHVAEADLTSDCGTEKVRGPNHFLISKIY